MARAITSRRQADARPPADQPPGAAPCPALNPVAPKLSDGRCPILARSLDGGGAALAQAVFLGEGIMIEVIFRPRQRSSSGRCLSPQDLAAILADSVALLQTPAVAEPT
jgi:hypothetical protein